MGLDKKNERMIAKTSIGKFVQTKCGEVLLVVENDYPILRVFDGKELMTINIRTIDMVFPERMIFPDKEKK